MRLSWTIAAVTLTAHSVFGCYCAPGLYDDSERAVHRAVSDVGAVVRGVVQSQRVANDAPGGGGILTVMEIKESWKGPTEGTINLGTVASDCRFNFESGEEYLVYAFPDANGMFATICSRTQRIDKADYDLNVLRRDPPPVSHHAAARQIKIPN